MEMEIDDDFNELNQEDQLFDNTTTEDITQQEEENIDQYTDTDVISEFLKENGIKDLEKIKFSNENGEEEEINWNSLQKDEKLNILKELRTPVVDSDLLEDDEIALINAVRESKMSPEEYINYIRQSGVDTYMQNSIQHSYVVDDLSDDELFISDMLTKVGEDNITDEELQQLLESSKANPDIFKKQIDAIRNEYKQLENQQLQQQQQLNQQQQAEQYNQFANNIASEIQSFTDICGYDINMDQSDMEELYEFITGFDSAGVSIFGKSLNEPTTLVKMAWFALNGEKAINDISNYWINQIQQIKDTSYHQGIEDAKNNKKNTVVVKPNTNNKNSFDDLDEF